MDAKAWTIRKRRGGTLGPFTRAEIVQLIAEGELGTLDEVRFGDSGGFSRLSEVATFAVALATCPSQQVAGLRRMWIAGQLVYDAASGDPASMLASLGEGPVFTFYNGSDDQLPDPRWQADKGINAVSGMPGVCYIVFHDLDLTEKYSNSLMMAQVEVEIVAEPVTITPTTAKIN